MLLAFAPLVYAGDQREESFAVHHGTDGPDPHAGIADFAALTEYVRQIGPEPSRPVASHVSPHPNFENADFTALSEYASEIGVGRPSDTTESDHSWVHPQVVLPSGRAGVDGNL